MSLRVQERTVDHVLKFDDYGFAIFKPGTTNAEDDDRCHQYKDVSLDGSSKKAKTWKRIMDSLDNSTSHFMSPHHLRQSIKCGVPKEIRGDLWNNLLDTKAIHANTSFHYQTSLEEIRCLLVDLGVSEYGGRNCIQRLGHVLGKLNDAAKDNDDDASPITLQERTAAKAEMNCKIGVLRQIMLDLDRTFPTHRRFMDETSEGKEGRASLFRVLAVYSQYNTSVSYCQGMSYIVGMLLMNMDEEKAFWCLVSLFERPKYLTGYFDNSLSKIQRHASVFEVIMKQRKNQLYKHLDTQGINPLMYLTPWFMALYTSLPCWDTVLFIWDMIFLEGVTVIFQVALALLEVLSDSLMAASEMCQSLPILLHPSSKLTNRERLVPVVFRLRIQKWEIESIQAVLAEKKEKQDANPKKRIKKETKENSPSYKRLKLETSEKSKQGKSVLVPHEPPIISRIVDYIAAPFRRVIGFGTLSSSDLADSYSNEIEMTTFSSNTGQSPPVQSRGCCSSPPKVNTALSPSFAVRSGNKYHTKRLMSPRRRSPRLLAKRRMKAFNASTSSLVGSSAKNQLSFRVFNTPTPLHHKFDVNNHRPPMTFHETDSPSQMTIFSPDSSFTSDVELMELNQTDKKLNYDDIEV